MDPVIRHLDPGTVFAPGDQVAYLPGQIVSKTLVQTKAHSLTLFAFDAGEEISTHTTGGDALVTVLDGSGQVTIAGTAHTVPSGQSILMPAEVPHAVFAPEPFKMSLLVVYPS